MTTIEFLVKIPWELILLLSLIMVGYGLQRHIVAGIFDGKHTTSVV